MEYRTNLADTQPIKRAARLLASAEQAAKEGNERRAYELSLRATEAAPGYVPAWALRSNLAPSVEEKIACINRLNELEPNDQRKHNSTFEFLKELLDREPFLAYLEETKELYHVLNKDLVVLRIPKGRTAANPYPPEQVNTFRTAHRWLALAMFGLMFAGIPTLIFAPLAANSALHIAETQSSRAGQVHCTIVEIVAIVLSAISCFFAVLFLLHLT